MNLSGLTKILGLSLICLLVVTTIQAEDGEKKRKLSKSGVLSGSVNIEGAAKSVDGEWGSQDTDAFSAEESPPVTGSVSRSGRDWVMKVFNNSEDTYRVQLEVQQIDKGQKKLKSDYFTYTLGPKSSEERKLASNSRTENCLLKLSSWDLVKSGKQKEADKKAAGDTEAIKGEKS